MLLPTFAFFLRFGDGRHAVAERTSTVARLERQGYTRIDYPTFMAMWRADDLVRALRLFGPVLVNPYDVE
jgi:hypothetical protein